MNTLEKAELTTSVPHNEIFKVKNTDLQFRNPRHGWQKNEKKKNTGSCKAFFFSRKHQKYTI